MNKKKDDSHTGLIAGLTAALAAGAVYFYGPEGERHRRKLHGWMLKTKGDVIERLEKAEEVSKERYETFVDAAIEEYAVQKAEKTAEVELLRKELKSEWDVIKERAMKKGEELKKAAAAEMAKKAQKFSENIDPENNN